MNLEELQAVETHKTLNPNLWDSHNLKPEVRSKLLEIAKHFVDFINIPNLDLTDITISGSNASYGYSKHSDVDLHLIARIPKDHLDLKELFNAKKNQYNSTYKITIKDIPVEVYVQDSSEPHHSAGIYSILRNKWLSKPTELTPEVDPKEIKNKARNYAGKINQALRSDDLNTAKETMDHIYRLRKAGLEGNGEYSVENLAFKLLRARGQIDKLRKRIDQLQSKQLSLGERQ
jgi:hypothetical protein